MDIGTAIRIQTVDNRTIDLNVIVATKVSRRDVSANSAVGGRTGSRERSLFHVTESIDTVTKVIAFGILQTDITAQFCATSFSANVVTEKIAIVQPFNTRSGNVPMVSSCTKLAFNHLNERIAVLNEMSFFTWFKFPRNVAAHALCGERWAGG